MRSIVRLLDGRLFPVAVVICALMAVVAVANIVMAFQEPRFLRVTLAAGWSVFSIGYGLYLVGQARRRRRLRSSQSRPSGSNKR